MTKSIDCLIIGHNQMDFRKHEEMVRKMGIDSPAHRDLNNNFLQFNNQAFNAAEIFDLFRFDGKSSNSSQSNGSFHFKPLSQLETFSAAIAYLGTYLYRRGFTFDYVNSFQDEKEDLAEKLKQENILTIAVTTTYYVSSFPLIEIINFIREHNQTAKIVVGGPYIGTRVRALDAVELECLFESTLGADFYVNSSQGEATLVKIIQALKNNTPCDQINNIYYKTGKGLASTPILSENNKLSDNMVNWDLFNHSVGGFTNIRTSISCPFSCAFCRFPKYAGKYQTAGVEDIEKELNLLNKVETIKCVYIIDDTFNIPLKRLKDILRMMIRNKYRFNWYSFFRCSQTDREAVQLMKESGCQGVYLGLESGSDQILKNMNKVATVDKYYKGIEFLKEVGIVTYGNFIIGFPGETYQTVRDTIRLIQQSEIDFYRAQLWFCEPAAPIWQQREKFKIEGANFEWSHKTMDSRTASDMIDEIVFTIEKTLWVPHFDFNFDAVWRLVHRGVSMEQIRKFLTGFRTGLRDKLKDPSQREISFDVVNQLKEACKGTGLEAEKNTAAIDNSIADFDF
jgi:radical SAM PhpK family P-methyltransferase